MPIMESRFAKKYGPSGDSPVPSDYRLLQISRIIASLRLFTEPELQRHNVDLDTYLPSPSAMPDEIGNPRVTAAVATGVDLPEQDLAGAPLLLLAPHADAERLRQHLTKRRQSVRLGAPVVLRFLLNPHAQRFDDRIEPRTFARTGKTSPIVYSFNATGLAIEASSLRMTVLDDRSATEHEVDRPVGPGGEPDLRKQGRSILSKPDGKIEQNTSQKQDSLG